MANDSRTMRLDDGCQGGRVEAAVGNPARELVVPDAVVSTHDLTVLLGASDNLVSVGEAEASTRGFSRVLFEV